MGTHRCTSAAATPRPDEREMMGGPGKWSSPLAAAAAAAVASAACCAAASEVASPVVEDALPSAARRSEAAAAVARASRASAAKAALRWRSAWRRSRSSPTLACAGVRHKMGTKWTQNGHKMNAVSEGAITMRARGASGLMASCGPRINESGAKGGLWGEKRTRVGDRHKNEHKWAHVDTKMSPEQARSNATRRDKRARLGSCSASLQHWYLRRRRLRRTVIAAPSLLRRRRRRLRCSEALLHSRRCSRRGIPLEHHCLRLRRRAVRRLHRRLRLALRCVSPRSLRGRLCCSALCMPPLGSQRRFSGLSARAPLRFGRGRGGCGGLRGRQPSERAGAASAVGGGAHGRRSVGDGFCLLLRRRRMCSGQPPAAGKPQ